MSKTNKIILIALIVAILMLGIGYAAIQNITLNITGTASADPSQANYNVRFAGNPIVSDSSLATTEMINDTTARIDAVLSTVGETVNVAYEVENASDDLSSQILLTTTNSNEEYFDISSDVENSILVAGESTLVTVTVELIKPAIEDNVTASIGVEIEAIPIQPGEESDLSGNESPIRPPEPGDNGSSAMTLKEVKIEDIGDYIDLGNSYINTEETSDDWRILYVDEEYVYAILADYLPGEDIPELSGVKMDLEQYPYSIWGGSGGKNAFYNELTNTEAWHDFTNEIDGATATGAPSAELLVDSYNTNEGVTKLEYEKFAYLDQSIEIYDLYVPHSTGFYECWAYWLATMHEKNTYDMWYIDAMGMITYGEYFYVNSGVRPVVSIPTSTIVEKIDEVWIVTSDESTITPEVPDDNGNAAMTLKDVTINNIGEYIDLGNNIINTDETTDDWRILYVDEENVHVILSGYLPAIQVPEAAGLDTNTSKYKYNVWSDKDLNTLINGFLNTEAWSSFTNGIEGATATGTPTLELLMNSYTTKDTSFETDYQWAFTLNRNIEDYDLYDPKVNDSNCLGYSFATPFKDDGVQLWVNIYNFTIGGGSYDDQYSGVRPVVSIPTSTKVEMIDEVWKILK